jgi:hypothetical protein
VFAIEPTLDLKLGNADLAPALASAGSGIIDLYVMAAARLIEAELAHLGKSDSPLQCVCRGVVQVNPCMGMELLGVLSGAWRPVEQRWITRPSSGQIGWYVAKPLKATCRIHRTAANRTEVERVEPLRWSALRPFRPRG